MEHIVNPLYNIEAEQTIIGCILVEPELLQDSVLDYQMFFDERHKNTFYTMRDLEEKGVPINLVSIVERVGNSRVEKIGGISYLTQLASAIATTENFNYYESVLIEHHKKRQAHEIGKTIMQEIGEKEGQVVQDAIEALMGIEDDSQDNEDGDIKEGLTELFDWMQEDHGEITGAKTGFRELDNITSGLQMQDLVIIGARPSMGKTAFALNVGVNTAENGTAVGIFSLEMQKQQLLKRMISALGSIDSYNMRNPSGRFKSRDWTGTSNALGILGKLPLHIFDKPGVDVGYIRRKCRMLRRLYPDKKIVIIVDYLQLIIGNPKFGGNRTQEVSDISRQLKLIAREMDVCMVALSQLSRAVEQRQDKRPMMSDLRESGGIEQDADVIGFLYRDDYYDKESDKKNIIEIIIAKQRNGSTGAIELAFIKEYGKFTDLDHKYGGEQ